MNILNESPIINIIASPKNWIEGKAIQELENTAKLPGIKIAIGMPDIHPGRGNPVGAAFFSKGIFYPHLVGNDVGCGMGLWQTTLKRNKTKRDRWEKKLHGLESQWEGDTRAWLAEDGLEPTNWDEALGTIGGGNHFAELQIVESVQDAREFENIGLHKDYLMLLVHSGSRGFGERILRRHIDQYKQQGLEQNSNDATEYLRQHDHAVKWARSNRALIAERFLFILRTQGDVILDICHNSVISKVFAGHCGWLHRKGAAPADEGPIVIPGSRGSFSYLVLPIGQQVDNCYSLAHGAGRKWNRSESKARLKEKYTAKSLLQTNLGSKVICEDKNLLYEEAPQAYKDIDIVVKDLQDAGLIRIVAILKPLITYKTRKR